MSSALLAQNLNLSDPSQIEIAIPHSGDGHARET